VVVIGIVFLTGGSKPSPRPVGNGDMSYEEYRAATSVKSQLKTAFDKGFEAGKEGLSQELTYESFLLELENKEPNSLVEDSYIPDSSTASDGILSVTRIAPMVVVGKMIYDIGTESGWDIQNAFAVFSAPLVNQTT